MKKLKFKNLIDFNYEYELTDYALDWIPKNSLFILDQSQLFYKVTINKYPKINVIVGLDKKFDIAGSTPKHIIPSKWKQKKIVKFLVRSGFLQPKIPQPFEEFSKELLPGSTGIVINNKTKSNIVDIYAYNDIVYDDEV